MSQATTRFIGLDVHKATITVAVAAQSGPPELRGTIANDPKAIRRLFERLAEDGSELKICYEAGPTGYALHRQPPQPPAALVASAACRPARAVAARSRVSVWSRRRRHRPGSGPFPLRRLTRTPPHPAQHGPDARTPGDN